jgi:galactokinase
LLLDSPRGTGAPGDAARADALAARFRVRFGETPRVYRAPGRVNLIGEHTDYNDGFVLPAAIGLSCWVAAAPRDEGRIVIESENIGKRIEWSLDEADPPPRAAWSSYALGVAALLRRRGERLKGATLLLCSDVPMGAGLSSSASLEVAVGTALCDLSGLRVGTADLARLCQRAEIEFAGARCGVMDQFVACHARAGHAILLDCRSLDHRVVPLPDKVRLVACNTMVRHGHAGGEYNRRRSECESAVARIAARFTEVQSLRDVDMTRLAACREELPDTVYRRCRHVITENERVLDAVRALQHADFETLEKSMADSHRSLRDDYEVSCPELDTMVEIAREMPGVLGTRMTGGGFGGCTVSLVREEAVDEFRVRVAERYEAELGRPPDIYAMDTADRAARVC